MGSFFSIQSRDKRRRSNRLSKPPSNKATLISSRQASVPNSPASYNSPTWQPPYAETSIPATSPELECSGRRSQSFPSASLQSEAPWTTTNTPGRSSSVTKDANESCIRSPASNTPGSLCRRASFQPSRQSSFQPITLRSEPPSPLIRPGQPRRSYSVHSPPQRANSAVHASSIKDATSSKTHFMVDSQGFSLIRRRSLLTRPGVATRRSTRDAARRFPSPIGQEAWFTSNSTREPSQAPQWPLSDRDYTDVEHSLPLAQFRPTTPSDFEYTHLGALKLGSLRVVNGSTSPCSSNRTKLNRARSPTPEASQSNAYPIETSYLKGEYHFLPNSSDNRDRCSTLQDQAQNSQGLRVVADCLRDGPERNCKRSAAQSEDLPRVIRNKKSTSRLQIPALPDARKNDDFPASPFSFEKSPTSPRMLFARELEDEGISVSDDEQALVSRLSKDTRENSGRKQIHSHRKVDSGYSSAASVRSLRDKRARTSLDSQASTQTSPAYRRFTLGDSSRDTGTCDTKRSGAINRQLPLHRHLSLQGSHVGSRPGLIGWPTSMSTMCHEPPQTSANGRVRSSSYTDPRASSRAVSLPRYCTQLRILESAATEVPLPSLNQSDISILKAPSEALCRSQPYGGVPGLHIDYTLQFGYERNGTETASKTMDHDQPNGKATRLLSPRPGTKPTTMPSTLIPEKARTADNKDIFIPILEAPRGRARSRSIEYQHHRMSKQQTRPNINMINSPFIFQ